MFGYLTHWDLGAQIDYEAITTIAYFSLSAGADGRLVRYNAGGGKTTEYSRWGSTRVRQVIADARAHGVKFVLTVDRMAWDDAGRAATRALLSSPTARTTLVRDIVGEVVARGIDGVSLDFEPILSDTRDQFAALLAELRAALDAVNPAYQLTFAATGSAPALTYKMYGDVTAAGWADAVLIMAYPLRGLGAANAGGLAPLYSPTSYDLKQIAGAYLAYVAADKMVMLLPWYGRQWPTTTADVNSRVQTDEALYDRPRNIGYSDAIPRAIAHGRNYDPVEQSAWTVYRWRFCADCPETWKQVYYEDVESLGYKYDWSLSKGFAGVGIWALGYDNERPELWQLLRTRFGGLVDTTPPTGNATVAVEDGQCDISRVRLELSAEDGPDGSGPVYVRVSNSPETNADGLLAYSRTYPATNEIAWSLSDPALGGSDAIGVRSVHLQWRDVAGNWSDPVSSQVDVTPAAGRLEVAAGRPHVADSTVDVVVEHVAGRPIARVLFSNTGAVVNGVLSHAVEGDAGVPLKLSMTDPLLGGSDVDGERTVYAQWQDQGGCWAEPVSASVVLDRVGPSGSLALVDSPSFSTSGEVGVLAPATDDRTGVARLELSNDGSEWHAFEPRDDAIAWSAGSLADGTWTIHGRWSDGAGNVSTAEASLVLDRNPPQGTLTLGDGAATTVDATVAVEGRATDAASDVVTIRLSNTPDVDDGVLAAGVDYPADAAIDWALDDVDGMRTVYAQWRDAAGHWSPVASASIVLDRAAPVVTAPRTALPSGQQLGMTSVPLAIAWSATDETSGVADVSLEAARGSALWSRVVNGVTATGSTVSIDRGTAWRFRLAARDVAGNVSVPAESSPVTAQVAEDRSAQLAYTGRWTTVQRTSASGGTVRYAKETGATVTYRFTGRSVAWVAAVAPHHGRARVLLDGRRVATVDLGAAAQQRRLVFVQNWATAGPHTITIRVLGTAGRPRVELDGFVILN